MTFKIRMDISEKISGKYYTVMVEQVGLWLLCVEGDMNVHEEFTS